MHASLAPVIVVGGVKPNLVLVGVVLVTVLAGFLPGITWAFVAGLTANLLVGDALGSVPLTMLFVAVLVAGGRQIFGRMSWVYPPIAGFLGSVVADLGALAIGQLVGDGSIVPIPFDLILAAAMLNAALVLVVLVPIRAIGGRMLPDEAGAW